MALALAKVEALDEWTTENLHAVTTQVCEELELGMGKPDVFVPINPSGKPSIQMDMKFELVDVVDRGQTYSPPWGNQALAL